MELSNRFPNRNISQQCPRTLREKLERVIPIRLSLDGMGVI